MILGRNRSSTAQISQREVVDAADLTPIGPGAGSVSLSPITTGGVAITATAQTGLLLPVGYVNARIEARFSVSGYDNTNTLLFGLLARGATTNPDGYLTGYILPALRLSTLPAEGEGRALLGVGAGGTNSLGGTGTGEFVPPGTLADYETAEVYMIGEIYCGDPANPATPTAYRAKMFLSTETNLSGASPDWQISDTTITRTFASTDYHWQDQTGCGFVIGVTGDPAPGVVNLTKLTATPIEGLF